MMHRFGENNWQPLIERMQRTFKDAGLEPMTLEGVVGPTFDSHRLIAVAERDFGESVQNALMEKLFYEYFIQGRNICTGTQDSTTATVSTLHIVQCRLMCVFPFFVLYATDLEVLTDCGRSVNIDNAADIVYGTDGTIEVQQQLDLAKRLEIKSVPTFIFEGSNGCTMFAGAQPVKSFERALRYVEPH